MAARILFARRLLPFTAFFRLPNFVSCHDSKVMAFCKYVGNAHDESLHFETTANAATGWRLRLAVVCLSPQLVHGARLLRTRSPNTLPPQGVSFLLPPLIFVGWSRYLFLRLWYE